MHANFYARRHSGPRKLSLKPLGGIPLRDVTGIAAKLLKVNVTLPTLHGLVATTMYMLTYTLSQIYIYRLTLAPRGYDCVSSHAHKDTVYNFKEGGRGVFLGQIEGRGQREGYTGWRTRNIHIESSLSVFVWTPLGACAIPLLAKTPPGAPKCTPVILNSWELEIGRSQGMPTIRIFASLGRKMTGCLSKIKINVTIVHGYRTGMVLSTRLFLITSNLPVLAHYPWLFSHSAHW